MSPNTDNMLLWFFLKSMLWQLLTPTFASLKSQKCSFKCSYLTFLLIRDAVSQSILILGNARKIHHCFRGVNVVYSQSLLCLSICTGSLVVAKGFTNYMIILSIWVVHTDLSLENIEYAGNSENILVYQNFKPYNKIKI